MNVVGIIHKIYIYQQLNTFSLKVSWWLYATKSSEAISHIHRSNYQWRLYCKSIRNPCRFFVSLACYKYLLLLYTWLSNIRACVAFKFNGKRKFHVFSAHSQNLNMMSYWDNAVILFFCRQLFCFVSLMNTHLGVSYQINVIRHYLDLWTFNYKSR
jgi:hypothetical protein